MDISELFLNFAAVKRTKTMKFELADLTNFFERDDGTCKGHVYSVIIGDEEDTIFEQFIAENETQYSEEIEEILNRLTVMVQDTGFLRNQFKHNEGAAGDGVAALRVKQMRLYLYYNDRTAIIVGSGGYKPPEAHAYQEVPELNKKAGLMKSIAKAIGDAVKERDLWFLEDGSIEETEFLDLQI